MIKNILQRKSCMKGKFLKGKNTKCQLFACISNKQLVITWTNTDVIVSKKILLKKWKLEKEAKKKEKKEVFEAKEAHH